MARDNAYQLDEKDNWLGIQNRFLGIWLRLFSLPVGSSQDKAQSCAVTSWRERMIDRQEHWRMPLLPTIRRQQRSTRPIGIRYLNSGWRLLRSSMDVILRANLSPNVLLMGYWQTQAVCLRMSFAAPLSHPAPSRHHQAYNSSLSPDENPECIWPCAQSQ